MRFTDEPYSPINYKIHIPIILLLVTIQFFVTDIYSFFYLKSAYSECLSLTSPNSTLYKKDEYSPISPKESPSDYEFVFVKKIKNRISEIYYTPKGRKEVVEFINGKFRSSYSDADGINYFLFLPFCGLLLFWIASIKFAFRTGTFFFWQQMRHGVNRFEKILFTYSATLLLSPIICIVFGVGP